MSPKRLVLLVEGPGDVEAAPILVRRLLKEYSAHDALVLDDLPPLCLHGGYPKLRKFDRIRKTWDFGEWRRLLRMALKTRKNMGGCLLLLDGDSKSDVDGNAFCAMQAAQRLVAEAEATGAGNLFSLAIVFACKEFESWLIAGVDSLLGQPFADGRKGMPNLLSKGMAAPANPELEPRDAKGWFRRVMGGYAPARDQAELTRLVDFNTIRNRKEMRSFRRMESAIQQLVTAVRSGRHTVTPT